VRPINIVAETNPQLIKRLLPVTARVAAGVVSGAGVAAGDAEVVGDGATGVPETVLDAAPSPWLLIAKSFSW
jgi:hypothetical protein